MCRRIPLVAQQVIVDVEIEGGRRDVLFDVRVHGIEGVPGDDEFGTLLRSFAPGYGLERRQAQLPPDRQSRHELRNVRRDHMDLLAASPIPPPSPVAVSNSTLNIRHERQSALPHRAPWLPLVPARAHERREAPAGVAYVYVPTRREIEREESRCQSAENSLDTLPDGPARSTDWPGQPGPALVCQAGPHRPVIAAPATR